MTVLVTETFASAPAFTQVGGALAVSGGYLQPSAAGTDCGGYSNTDMGTTDHYVEAVMVTSADTSDIYHSIIARWNGTDVNAGGTAYVLTNDWGDGILYKVVAGTFTTIATFVGMYPASSTMTIRLEVNGTSIGVLKGGVHQGASPYTDSAISTGTKVGVNMYSLTTATDVRFDSFEAGDFITGTPPDPYPITNARALRSLLIR